MNIILMLAFSTILSVWADENHGSHNEPPAPQDHSAHVKSNSPARSVNEPETEVKRPEAQPRPQVVLTPNQATETRITRQPSRVVEGLGQGRKNCDEPCVNCASDSSCKNTRAFDNSSESKEIPTSGSPSHKGHEGSSTSQQ